MDLPGHGFFAGWCEAEVRAKIDTCFHRGWVRFERTREGLPLIGYTDAGLEKAKGFAVVWWLKEVCGQVGAVADASWLLLLRAWQEAETKRMRGRLGAVIEQLEQ